MTRSLWTLLNVTLTGGPRSRLAEVSLQISSGTTAVLGWSGAGKTSLLNLLVGFERPSSGALHADSAQASTRLPLYWSPADGGLWTHLTTREHLAAVCDDPDPWLERFDLQLLANSRPEQLSLGEQSRLSVARGLAANPQVLVLDEPLIHVDSARIRRYWDVIRDTCDQQQMSLVFSHHDPELVLRQADQVICLAEGRCRWQGEVQELYQRPPSAEIGWFLGPLNWFESAEATRWLGRNSDSPICLRPEQLVVEPDDSGPLVVERARFCGSLAEVDVHLPEFPGQQRRVYHRPVQSTLSSGMRVSLRALFALLCCVTAGMLSGCGKSKAEGPPVLSVSEFASESLPAAGTKLPAPRGMTFSPGGELLVLDDVGRVLVYDASGELDRQWWMPEYSIGRPEGVCVLQDGRIAVADTHYHRIVFFDDEGNVTGMLGEFGRNPGQFIYTVSITQDPDGFLYVAEYGGNDRVQKFTADGEFVISIGVMGVAEGEFQRPSGVVWHEGKLYVADSINNRVQVFRDSGEFEGVLASAESAGLYYPYDIAKGPDATLYVVEYGAGRVTRLGFDGQVLGQYGDEGRGPGQFWTPWGLAVSREGVIVVADTGNRRMVELKP